MRPSSVWLAASAALGLFACYVDVPGSAIDPTVGGGDADATLGGTIAGGGGVGGTLSGDTVGGGAGGGADGGSALDAGSDSAVFTCDGVAVGNGQSRVRYAELQVMASGTCQSETQMRTCRASGWSAWSGTYQAETCNVAAARSCGAIPSGGSEMRTRYPLAKVSDASQCVPETQSRSCSDGTLSSWGGTATFESCQVSFGGRCNMLGAYSCEATTACSQLVFGTCIGTQGHVCSANGECQYTCVGAACTGAKVAPGGACDDSADCTACTSLSAAAVSATCAGNVCGCGNGAVCTANAQCAGTCAGFQCVAANTVCDAADDCSADYKCVKAQAASTGTCLLPDGKSCTKNAQCEHVCRDAVCGPKGMSGQTCDENVDCAGALVCRTSGAGLALSCLAVGQMGEFCDENADCAQGMSCGSVAVGATVSAVCITSGAATGSPCVLGLTGAAAAAQCASGTCECSNSGMGNGNGCGDGIGSCK